MGSSAGHDGPHWKNKTMAYTVKQVSAMSGVSVRALHFYDEVGLLKPAYHGANGYRYYEEPQLLTLQQILFYRELGFELRQIKGILGRRNFDKVAALKSHRKVLQEKLTRTHRLLETIDQTIKHLKGTKKMKNEAMFAGFRVAAGKDRFDEQIRLGGEPHDCKLSGKDTGGAMCVFEFTGMGFGPRHVHHEQDEWIYLLSGEIDLELDGKRSRVRAGESVFIPRAVPHGWVTTTAEPAKIINTYQPAGTLEEFFRELGKYDRNGKPQVHEALLFEEFCQLFQDHGMKVVGPPLSGEWKVDEGGRIVQVA